MTRFVFLALVAFPSSFAHDVILTRPAFDCRSFQESLPADFETGVIRVPLDRSVSESEDLEISYYGKWSSPTLRQDIPPILIFNGGPSYASASTFVAMRERLISSNLRFVFFDQRGTGCSSPYPELIDFETLEMIKLYNSHEIIQDAKALKDFLFGRQASVRLFGHSYGTGLSLRYVIAYPQDVERVIYSAILDVGASWDERIAGLKETLQLLHDLYTKHLELYPSDKNLLEALIANIDPEFCFVSALPGFKMCGSEFLSNLYWPLVSEDFERMHKLLKTFLSADGSVNYAAIEAVSYMIDMDPILWVLASYDKTYFKNGKSDCDIVVQELEAENPLLLQNPFQFCGSAQTWTQLQPYTFNADETAYTRDQLDVALQKNSTLPFIELRVLGTTNLFCLNNPQDSQYCRNQRVVDTPGGHNGAFTAEALWQELEKLPVD